MGAMGRARLIRSGQVLGGRGVRIGRDADKGGLPMWNRRGNDVGRGVGLHRQCDGDGEAAVAVVAGERLVIAMAGRTVVEDRGDLRAAGRGGDIDVVSAMQRTRQEVHHRDEHSHQPTPVARMAKSRRPSVRKHEIILAIGPAGLA